VTDFIGGVCVGFVCGVAFLMAMAFWYDARKAKGGLP
jgi:hypothetical protein